MEILTTLRPLDRVSRAVNDTVRAKVIVAVLYNAERSCSDASYTFF